MGCVVNKNKVTVQASLTREKELGIKDKRRNYFYKTSFSCWALIIDFLKYKEVKQAGRINKTLNAICRSHAILLKFYKKRRDSPKSDTKNLFNKIQQTLFSEELEAKPKAEKLVLRDNYSHKKLKVGDISTTNIKSSNISKTLHFDKISIGSFQELQKDQKKKPIKSEDNKIHTIKSSLAINYKNKCEEKANESKPKLYYDDYGNTKTSLFISKSLKDNCSDNMTPSFKDSENSHDFVSKIEDIVSQKNIIRGFKNNFLNFHSDSKKSSNECMVKVFTQDNALVEKEKEFSNSDDVIFHTVENEEKSVVVDSSNDVQEVRKKQNLINAK